MKLDALILRNFRCYKDEVKIHFGELTSIIGKNDVGKSTILEALEIFFNSNIVKMEPEDCCISANEKVVEIICEFSDIPDNVVLDSQAETNLEREYLLTKDKTLRVKKIYNCQQSRPKEKVYIEAWHPVEENFNDLLSLSNSALKKRLRDLGVNQENVHLNSNPSIRQAIWSFAKSLNFDYVDIQVDKEDGKNIWEKINLLLPVYALFQSDRQSKDSDVEVQDPMRLAVETALSAPDVKEKLSDVVDAVREKAIDLARRTHQTLLKIDPNIADDLIPEFQSDPKWSNQFKLFLNSSSGIPINKRGSGVRRLILVSFFRAEADRRLAENETSNIIYAIEEPETSQHPDNQKILLNSLCDLAEENGCQVLITTHSPNFANYLPLESLRYIHEENQEVNIDEGCEDIYAKIVDTLGIVPDNRVRVLLYVEGPTDIKALKCLSHALHLENPDNVPDLLNDSRISFILSGGSTLKYWVEERFLREFGRPEVHIYDNDVKKYRQYVDEINSRSDGSWAVLTKKREIENYLHPDAVEEGIGVRVVIEDNNDVPASFRNTQKGWNSSTAKIKLADKAFPKMTADRIKERDPDGEVEGWFIKIGEMLSK